MLEVRPLVHMVLHVAVPGAVAGLAFRDRWRWAWAVMLLGMIVDVDHLLATPIFDPNRCSIGFHPLHTYPAIAAYALAAVLPVARVLAIGLLIHMGLDGIDCAWQSTF